MTAKFTGDIIDSMAIKSSNIYEKLHAFAWTCVSSSGHTIHGLIMDTKLASSYFFELLFSGLVRPLT